MPEMPFPSKTAPVGAAGARAAFSPSLIGKFHHPVSLYRQPPEAPDVFIDEFEAATAYRLKALHFIDEKFGLDSSVNPAVLKNAASSATPAVVAVATGTSSSLRKPLWAELEAILLEGGLMLPRNAAAALAVSDAQRTAVALRDAVSHFALRMAFSQDRQKQQWFTLQESRLLMFRFDCLANFRDLSDASRSLVSAFLEREGLGYQQLQRPKDACASSGVDALWRQATAFRGQTGSLVETLYLVPCFPDAGQLVRNRRVFVKNMMAYVPDLDLDSVVLGRLRSELSKSFELLDGRQGSLQSHVFGDPRVGGFLSAAPNVYMGRDFNANAATSTEERLTPKTVKLVYRQSFPPCMRRLYEAYSAERHLRHGGRMQLWLFFKGAGMTMEESLHFNRQLWREPQKFEKEHGYNIRHLYGLEGKRTNYAPMRCSQIIGGGILGTPGAGDFHGCPFRHFDAKKLQKLFEGWGLSYKQIQPILKHKESGDFQLACREYFLQTHSGSGGDDVGNHPNAFFAASRRFIASQTSNPASQKRPSSTASEAPPQESAGAEEESREAVKVS